MKKLILILSLIFCLVIVAPVLAFEKVDISGVNFDTDVIFRAKIVEFLEQLNIDDLGVVKAVEGTDEVTAVLANGRQIYWNFGASSIEGGESLTGLMIASKWAGTVPSPAAGIVGIEIKAKAASDSITASLGQARAIVANVDVKKAEFTYGYCVEAQIDIAAGGTITTGVGVRSSLNNSGTLTNGYAFSAEGISGNGWPFALNVNDCDALIHFGSATDYEDGIKAIAGAAPTGTITHFIIIYVDDAEGYIPVYNAATAGG